MSEQNKLALAAIPRISFALVNTENNLTKLTNKGSYCVAGASVKNEWEYNSDCAKLVAEFKAGCDADVNSGLKDDSQYWEQASNTNTTGNRVELSKAFAILSLNRTATAECDLHIGYGIENDCNPLKYYGCGFEGFDNPYIVESGNFGIGLNYKANNIECFARIQNAKSDSSSAPNGFLFSDNAQQCDLGVCFDTKGKMASSVMLVCSQLDNIDISVLGVATPKAVGAVTASLAVPNKDKLTPLTAMCSSEISPGVHLGLALACMKLEGGNSDARILKWSAGCTSVCKKVHLPKHNKTINVDAYGIHVGTPAYLQNDYNTTITKDETPLVCEISCLTNFCGLTIPLYIDIMNKWQRLDENDEVKEGNVCIVGLKAESLFGFACGADGDAKCFEAEPFCPEGGEDDE